jgi:hypothetical protein
MRSPISRLRFPIPKLVYLNYRTTLSKWWEKRYQTLSKQESIKTRNKVYNDQCLCSVLLPNEQTMLPKVKSSVLLKWNPFQAMEKTTDC